MNFDRFIIKLNSTCFLTALKHHKLIEDKRYLDVET
jgi:hypothetical protein